MNSEKRTTGGPGEPTVGHKGALATRRSFLKYAAAGTAAVAGVAGASRNQLLGSSKARAATTTREVNLVIAEGEVRMVDGHSVFMLGFNQAADYARAGFTPPGRVFPLRATEGDFVHVTVENRLAEEHTFDISGIIEPLVVPAGQTAERTFTAPEAGTYIYADPEEAFRMLGLYGVFVVMPVPRPDGKTTSFLDGPTFTPPDFVWNLHDIDPVLADRARASRPGPIDPVAIYDLNTFLPRYFVINGLSGEDSINNVERPTSKVRNVQPGPKTVPVRKEGERTLIRLVNTGVATHACHFHGNHVHFLRDSATGGTPAPVDPRMNKDVIRVTSLIRRDVLLPYEFPGDVFPRPTPPFEFDYPMHCHSEMSQTAAGGNYPSGMLGEWVFVSE